MMDENTTDTHDLEYVDASQVAVMVVVDMNGHVDIQGVASAEYVAYVLRDLVDQFERDGWKNG